MKHFKWLRNHVEIWQSKIFMKEFNTQLFLKELWTNAMKNLIQFLSNRNWVLKISKTSFLVRPGKHYSQCSNVYKIFLNRKCSWNNFENVLNLKIVICRRASKLCSPLKIEFWTMVFEVLRISLFCALRPSICTDAVCRLCASFSQWRSAKGSTDVRWLTHRKTFLRIFSISAVWCPSTHSFALSSEKQN